MPAAPNNLARLSPLAVDADWLASLLDASGAALVAVDRNGHTLFWSRGAEALFGWPAAAVLGKVPPIVPAPLFEEWHLQMQRVLDSGKPTPAAETQRVARDGRLISVVRSATPLRAADGRISGLLDALTDVTALKQIEEDSRALSQVRERELIAMDLHDGLIQSLYALTLTLDARKRALSEAERAGRDALQDAIADVQRVMAETRSYLFDLRARGFAPRNIEAGLRLLADSLRLNGNLEVELTFDRSVEPLVEPAIRGHVLYLVREAISNVLRHAHATTVHIAVGRHAGSVSVLVADNGRGFSPARRKRAEPGGLRNMAARARLVGGRLQIDSSTGDGTRISLEIPIEP